MYMYLQINHNMQEVAVITAARLCLTELINVLRHELGVTCGLCVLAEAELGMCQEKLEKQLSALLQNRKDW